MKIELEQNNKVFVFEGPNKLELHPIWLRERVSEKEHLDKNTEQRLFDPSLLKDIKINKVTKGHIPVKKKSKKVRRDFIV